MNLDPLKQRWLPLVLAVGFGVTAVVWTQRYLDGQRRILEAERTQWMARVGKPIEVLVATKDLSEGLQLDRSHAALKQIPEQFVQPYATDSVDAIIGLITRAPIAEGEQVLLNKLRQKDEPRRDAVLSSLTPVGKRAVTIGIDAIGGVGGFVLPGDYVDILWTFQIPQKDGQVQMTTVTAFQNVKVLAVGPDVSAAQRTATAPDQQPDAPLSVTLAIDPDKVGLLLLAREQGRIQLSLRSRREGSTEVPIPPANLLTLLEAMPGFEVIPEEARSQQPGKQIEVYRGLERKMVILPGRSEP